MEEYGNASGGSNLFNNIANELNNSINRNNKIEVIKDKLKEIDSKIEEIYIGEIDSEKQVNSALEGYVSALGDEYTEYLTKEEVKDLMQQVDGEYVGIGVYISKLIQSNEIIVIGVIKGTPAEKSGIQPGDIIKKVDDKEYNGDQLTTASNEMKGIAGTEVKITIVRDNEEKEILVTREKIKLQYVSSEMLDNKVGYIQISAFEGSCSIDFLNQYNELKKQGVKSLIIDLRNNGGGLVDESLKIANYIVPKGSTTLITKDKKNNEDVCTSNQNPVIDTPIVILVNEYTASASEILTAAIKENTNAKVVGTTTYGKGIIQGVYLLSDQETGLKITMQEYYTPKHNKIHKVGITPNVEIELPNEWKGKTNVPKEYDTQLNKAIELLK